MVFSIMAFRILLKNISNCIPILYFRRLIDDLITNIFQDSLNEKQHNIIALVINPSAAEVEYFRKVNAGN